MTKPCLTCGEPTDTSYCDEHAPKPWRHRDGSARARGYDHAWDKLSKRARALQPFCSLCFSTEDLTTDHKPEAWKRKAAGKSIRLRDVRVLCNDCNVDAGTSRPDDQGKGALEGNTGPRAKAQSRLLSDICVGRAGIDHVDGRPADTSHDLIDVRTHHQTDAIALVPKDQGAVGCDFEGLCTDDPLCLSVTERGEPRVPIGGNSPCRHSRSLS